MPAIGPRARIGSGEPSLADDVAGLRWVAESEVDALDRAWGHDRRMARRTLKEA